MAFATGSDIDSGNSTSDNNVTNDTTSTRTTQFTIPDKKVYSTSNHSKAIDTDSTDEVDIRKLVNEPSIDDIRWLYRQFFASTIVDKPIDDAYKNGFDVTQDPTDSVRPLLNRTGYIDVLKRAEKKARRDGFALIYKICNDSADWAYEPSTSSNFNSLESLTVLTIDDLTSVPPTNFREQQLPPEYQPTGSDSLHDLIEVRDTGIVVSRRRDDPSFGDPIGYLVNRRDDGGGEPLFVHESRIQHIAWRDTVDGEYHDGDSLTNWHATDTWGALGEWEGDSILTPAYHILKSLFKGDWATMQTLFRYSSPLYEMKLPERADRDNLEDARDNFRNLNSKSDIVTPFGYEVEMHDTDGQLDPQAYFDPIFEQICASVEMNKSVLFGMQSGVNSSETDVKNYFNQVERYQQGRGESRIDEFVRWVFDRDQTDIPSFALGYEIDWNDVFELGELDKAEVLRSTMQSISNAFNDFAISPSESRSLVREAFDKAGFETDLEGELTPEDYDLLSELNVAQQGNAQLFPTGPGSESQSESQGTGNPRMQNNGGMEAGQSTASQQPNRA